jgi:hypothetical protein
VERLPIAIVVGADMLRRELDPAPEATRRLRLERLRNEVYNVAALLRRAIAARPEEQRLLLNAMAVCALEGFWLPMTVQIAGVTIEEGRDARNRLVDASLLRMLDRDSDDGLQTRSGSPKALAPAPGLRTDPKVATGVRFVDGEEQTQQAA